jgi:hypothetical protein
VRDPNEKVVVAYLFPVDVKGAFMESMIHLLMYDASLHRRITDGGGGFMANQAGANLSGPRNDLVERFLAYGKADWLWMVDSDMTFGPDIVERLMEFADPETAPIVGGLCFGFDSDGEVQPTLFGLHQADDEDDVQVIRYHTWDPDSMFQVAATGAACLLIHKSALERIRDFQPPNLPGQVGFNRAFPWFQETEINGRPVGEDFTFCWRAGMCEIPIFVNTAVRLGHIKSRLLTMESYFVSRGLLSPTHKGAAL